MCAQAHWNLPFREKCPRDRHSYLWLQCSAGMPIKCEYSQKERHDLCTPQARLALCLCLCVCARARVCVFGVPHNGTGVKDASAEGRRESEFRVEREHRPLRNFYTHTLSDFAIIPLLPLSAPGLHSLALPLLANVELFPHNKHTRRSLPLLFCPIYYGGKHTLCASSFFLCAHSLLCGGCGRVE